MKRLLVIVVVVGLSAGAVSAAASELPAPAESKRLASAKDFIADEQWMRAIEVLNVMLQDAKETGKDEALYWLAHSQNHSGDPAAALSTIRRLETEHPSSLWVRPAGALRIEIAVRLGRSDVLWRTAMPWRIPPPPAVPSSKPAGGGPAGPPPPVPPTPASVEAPPTPRKAPPPPVVTFTTPLPPGPGPATIWLPEKYQPAAELRVQALGHLIRTDADRAIPMLKEICFETSEPGPASLAVFVLAQSKKPEAHETVVEVAKLGPTAVRVAAVRELGRFGGADAPKELLLVYPTGDAAVKLQVVKSLGERSEHAALMKIVQSEGDRDLRIRTILVLGQAGGAKELRFLYPKFGPEFKRAILRGLFNARAETELIYIADSERDRALRQEVFSQLRLLGTPKAKEYLQKVSESR